LRVRQNAWKVSFHMHFRRTSKQYGTPYDCRLGFSILSEITSSFHQKIVIPTAHPIGAQSRLYCSG